MSRYLQRTVFEDHIVLDPASTYKRETTSFSLYISFRKRVQGMEHSGGPSCQGETSSRSMSRFIALRKWDYGNGNASPPVEEHKGALSGGSRVRGKGNPRCE